MSRLRVAAAESDALVDAFRGRAHLVDTFDGFTDLQVWRSDRDPEEVLMVSRWRDRAAFTAYMRSAAHRASHARIDASLQAAIRPGSPRRPPSGSPAEKSRSARWRAAWIRRKRAHHRCRSQT